MSAAVAPPPVAAPPAAKPRPTLHRRAVQAWVLCVLAAAAAILYRGAAYYIAPAAQRAGSPLHDSLRPSGELGHALGMLGGVLFLMVFLYPLRKHWKWLARRGKTRNWLDYHILLGLTAPLVITFHSAFKLHGVAGLAYWIMLSVVASGIIGRYLYGRIPRRLDQAAMSLEEMAALRRELEGQLEAQKVLTREEWAPLLALPRMEEVHRMPLLKALGVMVVLDLKRPMLLLALRRKAGAHVAANTELKRALAIVRKQTAISRDIVFLSKAEELFRWWHVIHRPFSYSFLLLSALHVAIVTILGFY